MVEMTVYNLGLDQRHKQHMVILKEREGKRILPIVVGECEAFAIWRHLSGIPERRPLTHDLIKNLLDHLQVKVSKITVHDLRENIYYARITLVSDGVEEDVDARPSDAIALALRVGAPIFVDEKVISEGTFLIEDNPRDAKEEAEVDKKFQQIIKDIDLNDLS